MSNSQDPQADGDGRRRISVNRRDLLLSGSSLVATSALASASLIGPAKAQPRPAAPAQPQARTPNILVIMGDDIGWLNLSAYHQGLMRYRTPNIDRIANEGARFTDWYGQLNHDSRSSDSGY